MDLTLAKLILGVDETATGDELNEAMKKHLRAQHNVGNTAAKNMIIEARDFLLRYSGAPQADETITSPEIHPELRGWVRRDTTIYCSSDFEKTYLRTEFINFDKKILFAGCIRLPSTELSPEAAMLPDITDRSTGGGTGGSARDDEDQSELRILNPQDEDDRALYQRMYDILKAHEFGYRCPHCDNDNIFTSRCGTVFCSNSKSEEDLHCEICGRTYERSKLTSRTTVSVANTKAREIGSPDSPSLTTPQPKLEPPD